MVIYASVLTLLNGRADGFGPGVEFNADRFQWNLEEIMTEAGSDQLKVEPNCTCHVHGRYK